MGGLEEDRCRRDDDCFSFFAGALTFSAAAGSTAPSVLVFLSRPTSWPFPDQ